MRILFFTLYIFLFIRHVDGQLVKQASKDSIGSHKIVLDKEGGWLSWYQPEVPGAAFTHVSEIASKFIHNGVPVDPTTGLKLYFIACGFDGPQMNSEEKFKSGKTWSHWLHNPACLYAGMVQSLVTGYRVYSGDSSYLDIVQDMLDYQLSHGTTPDNWLWASVPYASSNGGDTIYHGGTQYSTDGRGDGLYCLEPDKIAELGNGYLTFYETTNKTKYLHAAMACADALGLHVRDTRQADSTLSTGRADRSPWPFRVNARTNMPVSEYCSNVIEPIKLFDELLRIKKRIQLSSEREISYIKGRNIAWEWLFSKNGPLKTYIWNAYFEDIPNDTTRANRNQITPLETARYLLKHYSDNPDVIKNIPVLIDWVKLVFSEPNMPAINEQTWCYEPMASHTARFASVAALWYEYSKDEKYKEDAYRYFNFATYLADTNGIIRVGPNWPGSWFSDGYGDYIRHFQEGVAAIPEWAPATQNHLLRSSSMVQTIRYEPKHIRYSTFDDESKEVFRLISKPLLITENGNTISELNIYTPNQQGWIWEPLNHGGVLRLNHKKGTQMAIQLGR